MSGEEGKGRGGAMKVQEALGPIIFKALGRDASKFHEFFPHFVFACFCNTKFAVDIVLFF